MESRFLSIHLWHCHLQSLAFNIYRSMVVSNLKYFCLFLSSTVTAIDGIQYTQVYDRF